MIMNYSCDPKQKQDFYYNNYITEKSQKLDRAKDITSLTGYKAFDEFIRLSYNSGDTAWFKIGNNRFIVGQIDKDGSLGEVWETKGENTERKRTTPHPDGYTFLSDLAKRNYGGVFYIPGKPEEFPLKDYTYASNDIGAEMDDGTEEEQLGRIKFVEELSGLQASLLIGSGGKSKHTHYILTESVDIDRRSYFAKLLCIALIGDPAVTNAHQPMRAPGFLRREIKDNQLREKEQLLEKVGDRYTPEAFSEGMERCFEALDFKFYDEADFSEERWKELKRVLSSKDFNRLKKEIEIKRILSLSEEYLPANTKKKASEEKAAIRKTKAETSKALGFNYIGGGSLVDAVNEWKRTGGRSLFDWSGHNWDGADKRGCCPWHDSTTGTSFWLSELEDGTVLAHCPTCTDNEGIDALTYQYSLQYGTVTHPTGKDWADFAKKVTGFVDAAPFTPTPEEAEDWKEKYERARVEKAIFKFTRKADVEVSSGYLPNLKLSDIPSRHLGLKGDWGIGKTTLISGLCKGYNGKIIQVGHLNALLENTSPKFLCIHHKALKANGDYDSLHSREGSRIAITIDSLASQLDPEKWAWGRKFILILDEVEQVLDYCHHSQNIKSNRLAARAKLIWLIKNAEYIVSSDRDLCDASLDFIEGICGDGKKAYLIHHTEQKGLGRTVKVNTNTTKDVVLERMVWDVRAGKKIAIACENKTDLLMIEKILSQVGVTDKEFFFAHGDNSNEKGVKEVIARINEEYTNYNILGYTMTLGTAVSLEIPHFDKVYGFFTGDAFGAGKQAQMLFRYRIECEIEIWVNPRKRTLEISEEKMLKDLTRSEKENGKFLARFDKLDHLTPLGACPTIDGSIPASEMDWLMHGFGIRARENASMANPSQSLCDLLESAGFDLEIECSEDTVKTLAGEEGREIKKEIKEKDDIAIAHAKLLTDDEYKEALKGSGSLTKEQRNELKKTFLNKETGLEVTPELVKKERTKNFTSAVKMLRIVLGSEEDAIAADLTQAEGKSVGDKKYYSLRRNLFIKLGAVDLIEYLIRGGSYASKGGNSLVKEVANNIRINKSDIKRLLGYKVNTAKITKNAIGGEIDEALQNYKVSDANLVNELLGKLAIKPASKDKRLTTGETFRIYSLDPQNWDEITGVIEHQKTLKNTPKWETFLEAKKAKFLEAESQAGQGQNMAAPPTNFSYIKDQGGAAINQPIEMTIKNEQKPQPLPQAYESKELPDPTVRMMERLAREFDPSLVPSF
ncbi:hypothetical protein HUN01_28535 [Nostoc edaphicum CCNP1411]|uniref:Replication origin-binding protein domain-containing protein n=1 Tax=Nostoc edaphicum CCNP1411 TaxID=1472755 RepID=A0A7D7LI44_9NOSO|nr:plasmid replication protein, CyRepA1 family [Nostoc edaphicum]QMS91352.1 hypothetical protein HUN01_28535 [Nostoc edaphicum CCNP1411]